MILDISEQVEELKTTRDLLTTQKEVLELRAQIAELVKSLESSKESENEGDQDVEEAEEESDAEEESGAEEELTGFSSYLSEITAYELLKATAQKIRETINEEPSDDKVVKVLVFDDHCMVSKCLPLSDVTSLQTKEKIKHIKTQVIEQIETLKKLLPKEDEIIIQEDETRKLEDEREEPPETKTPLYEVISSFLTNWGSPVTSAIDLVRDFEELVSQFASSFAFQEQDIALPLDALIAEIIGGTHNKSVTLLSMGCIMEDNLPADSVLKGLNELNEHIHNLKVAQIKLTTMVVEPLAAQALEMTNNITKLENEKEQKLNTIIAKEKLIAELNVKFDFETDQAKKKELEESIAKHKAILGVFNTELEGINNLLETERIKLGRVNLLLSKPNAELLVATKLVEIFTAFVKGITEKSEADTLSIFAQVVLRDYISNFDRLLRLKIHSGDVETITRKFLGFKSMRFIGGCVVSYTLTDTCGNVLKSGLEIAAGQRKFRFSDPKEMRIERIPTKSLETSSM
jgi:hypothetical protein